MTKENLAPTVSSVTTESQSETQSELKSKGLKRRSFLKGNVGDALRKDFYEIAFSELASWPTGM